MKNEEERIRNILPILLQYAQKDFTQSIPVSGTGDPIDALAISLNSMAKEMHQFIVERNHNEDKIKISNAFLEEKLIEHNRKLAEGENFFNETLDKMLEGMQIIDFNWRYVYVNESLARQSHYRKEELLGRTMMEMYPGIQETPLFKVLIQCMEKRTIEYFENEFEFPDHSKTWFELSIQPVPEGIFILSIDITERKRVENEIRELNDELEQKVVERTAQLSRNIQQLKESEEKFQKTFQSSAAGISITKVSTSAYLDVNEAFIKMTGFSKGELIGHTSLELGLIVSLQRREEVLQQVRESGSARNFEMTISNKAGAVLQILASVETIILNDEKYAINIIYDITDRKKAEEELKFLNKELEAFSFSISHDLRAPLRNLNALAQMLDNEFRDQLGVNGVHLITKIRSAAEKMSTLIDELLAFSQLGKKEVRKQQIDMQALTAHLIQDLSRAEEFHTAIKIGTLHSIQGDYTLIQQVMFNLLSNAIKYSSGKKRPQVEIASEEREDEIIFSIKDNGAGFDMQFADKLFIVFERLHTYDEFEGTGVGLAIVERIISKHGGRVWAEGKVNKGAVFYFALPKN